MFDWWYELPVWLRAGVAVLLLLISTVLWFAGWIWPWGWAAGAILLVFSGSGSNSKGYRF